MEWQGELGMERGWREGWREQVEDEGGTKSGQGLELTSKKTSRGRVLPEQEAAAMSNSAWKGVRRGGVGRREAEE